MKTAKNNLKIKRVREITKKLKGDVNLPKDMLNLPTFLNVSRIILTFVISYMIVVDSRIILIVSVFAFAAITDWLDGYFARKFKLTNDFGRKADMFADRFLWIGTSVTLVFVFGIKGRLEAIHGLQILLIMTREIISAPFALAGLFSGSVFPPTRYIAKVTTFVQGFALPSLMLSIFYPIWFYVSLPLSLIIGVAGAISGLHYIHDLEILRERKKY
ncbi:CDP-alcohol phosphatidyltransferase family protein [Candidatus Pacearchaeota archaeon]|nr:CDP-alcohol phosphatidyltransferase family protein [Candidatus Pacearchaeota archaeon]